MREKIASSCVMCGICQKSDASANVGGIFRKCQSDIVRTLLLVTKQKTQRAEGGAPNFTGVTGVIQGGSCVTWQ